MCKKGGEIRKRTCTNVNAHLLIFAKINIGKINQKLVELVTYSGRRGGSDDLEGMTRLTYLCA